MGLVSAVLIVFILVCISEFWWRRHPVHTELSRKFVHITVGSFVAFWPFFLTWHEIEFMSVAFFVVVTISKQLKILKAIHSVQRPTWGELFFALTVGLTAFITHNKWIYMTALLQMSLADGLAAIVGIRYGKQNSYRIFGQAKSLAGTGTFFVVSLVTLLVDIHIGVVHQSFILLLSLAIGASLIENLGTYGLDNILVPVLIAGVLRIIG
jgi:phytol kinase